MSHSSVDKPFVRFIAKELLACGHTYWLDAKDLLAGDLLSASIEAAINSANRILVFISPASVNSEWVRREIEFAKRRHSTTETAGFVPCVIGDINRAGFPDGLDDILYIDLRDARSYETQMQKLLMAVAHSGESIQLPSFDAYRCGELVDFDQIHIIRQWVLDWLCAAVANKEDATERYWMYIAIGQLGDQGHLEFLRHAANDETGFAKGGAQEGFDILQRRIGQRK